MSNRRMMMFSFGSSGIVTDGLVLHLDASNPASYPGTGTTWTDLTTPQENGTLINGVGYSSANQGSLVFDGVNDYVDVFTDIPQSFTIQVWVKSNTLNWNNDGFIASLRKPNGFILHPLNATKNIMFFVYTSGGASIQIGSIIPMDNIQQWNHITLASNGSNSHKAYINAVEVANSSVNISRTSSATKYNLKIANDDTTARYLNGNISVVNMYNRSLTASEITQNFNALKNRYGL